VNRETGWFRLVNRDEWHVPGRALFAVVSLTV
jgi:hypothetical protein